MAIYSFKNLLIPILLMTDGIRILLFNTVFFIYGCWEIINKSYEESAQSYNFYMVMYIKCKKQKTEMPDRLFNNNQKF